MYQTEGLLSDKTISLLITLVYLIVMIIIFVHYVLAVLITHHVTLYHEYKTNPAQDEVHPGHITGLTDTNIHSH